MDEESGMNKVLSIKITGRTNNKVVEDRKLIIPVGRGYLLKTIDESLKTKKAGDEYELTLKPEQGYGERMTNLIKLVPMKYFRKDNVTPYPGLIVNIDGLIGKVRSVSPGRILIDFNHPLAGKTLEFKIKIIKELKDKALIAKEIIKSFTGMKCKVRLVNKKLRASIDGELPLKIKNKLEQEVREVLGITVEILTRKA